MITSGIFAPLATFVAAQQKTMRILSLCKYACIAMLSVTLVTPVATYVGIDRQSPVIVSNSSGETDYDIHIMLSDNDSGIDYEKLSAIDENGNTIIPISVDSEKDIITFAYPDSKIDIYIPDHSGNVLHAILSPRGQ